MNVLTDSLKPEEYQAIIAPALHAAADIAAARGDPDLYNDLAAMLTLMTLVRDLSDLYQYHWGALGQMSPAELFEQAPVAACVIVLHEQELPPEALVKMTEALEKAYNMLHDENILGRERVEVQRAWDAQLRNNPDLAHAHMKQAARICVAQIDQWEIKRRQIN